MSKPIDIKAKKLSSPSHAGLTRASDIATKNKPGQKRGQWSRFLFTLAITTAICLSIICFLYILGRSTEPNLTQIQSSTRSTETIFSEALLIEEKPLKLRALRNFIGAYPDTPHHDQASALILELEADEHKAWLSLTDIFYTIESSDEQKLEAVEIYMSQWGQSEHVSELAAMREQLETDRLDKSHMESPAQPELSMSPALDRAQIAPEISPSARSLNDSTLAGAAPPPSQMQNARIIMANPEPEPVLIVAKIIDDVSPDYPNRARSRGIEATVIVAMDIDDRGEVKDAYIVRPATGRYANDFGRAAIRAAEKTKFSPKTIDGVPQPTNGFTRRYRFEIEPD